MKARSRWVNRSTSAAISAMPVPGGAWSPSTVRHQRLVPLSGSENDSTWSTPVIGADHPPGVAVLGDEVLEQRGAGVVEQRLHRRGDHAVAGVDVVDRLRVRLVAQVADVHAGSAARPGSSAGRSSAVGVARVEEQLALPAGDQHVRVGQVHEDVPLAGRLGAQHVRGAPSGRRRSARRPADPSRSRGRRRRRSVSAGSCTSPSVGPGRRRDGGERHRVAAGPDLLAARPSHGPGSRARGRCTAGRSSRTGSPPGRRSCGAAPSAARSGACCPVTIVDACFACFVGVRRIARLVTARSPTAAERSGRNRVESPNSCQR